MAMTDAQLRARVRELMALGNLPNERPQLHQAGTGPSRLAAQSDVCLICGERGPNVTYVWSGGRVANPCTPPATRSGSLKAGSTAKARPQRGSFGRIRPIAQPV